MLEPQKYSERLGVIDPRQLHEASARAGFGEVVDAYVPAGSLLGQNLVVETTRGRFVLRGNPYGLAQLTKERRVAQFVNGGSSLPVPWPYRVWEDAEPFGWPYAVMPCLPGTSGAELGPMLDDGGREALSAATGEALARLHEATAEGFGPYDAQLDGFVEMDDFADWFLYRLEHWRTGCRSINALPAEAEVYIDQLVDECSDALDEPFVPVLVHRAFEPWNLNFEPAGKGFEVVGVFDLCDAHLGDGEEDLARMLRVAGSDTQRRAFVDAYVAQRALRPGARERLSLYALADWLVAWERGCRMGTFSAEEVSFVASARKLVDQARDV